MISDDGGYTASATIILRNMTRERTGWRRYVFGRWLISDEPLRVDAANLLRRVGLLKEPDDEN